ncbi:MAG: PAS domain S-box protein [Promethearchaeota archaeon]
MEFRKKILIVEDEWIVAKDIKNSIEQLGYEVTSIESSGEQALLSVELDQPDLVIMDIKLEGNIDGIETTKRLNSQFNLPIIYISAYYDESYIKRLKTSKPSGFLTKPLNIRELHAAIEISLYKLELEKKLKKTEVNSKNNKNTTPFFENELHMEKWVKKRLNELQRINQILTIEIDARKMAQHGLREGQEFLRGILSSLDETLIIVFDEDGLINFAWGANTLEERYGIKFKDFMGEKLETLFSITADKESSEPLKDIFDSEKKNRKELKIEMSSGSVWMDVTFSAIKGNNNQITGMIAAAREITDIQNSEEFFNNFFNSIDDLIFVLDLEGNVIQVNSYFIKRMGYSEDEIKKMSVFDLHHQNQRNKVKTYFSELISNERDIYKMPLKTKEGSIIFADIKVTVGYWLGKKAIFGVGRDILENKSPTEAKINT